MAHEIESLNDARTARWLERVLHLLPIEPRPEGYSPLGEKNLDPRWVARRSVSTMSTGATAVSPKPCLRTQALRRS